jgi:hypothetical protein
MDFKSTFHRPDEISAIEIELGRQSRKLRKEYLFYV